jgi:sugar lactone lactonase YvrE
LGLCLRVVVLLLAAATPVRAATIFTVAGTGEPRSFGDGLAAANAGFDMPSGVAFGADGTVFVSDYAGNVVRRIDPATGIITTVAGTGPDLLLGGAFSGDGGPAVKAALNAPNGIALGPDGSLYIADSQNQRIRRVDRNGIISTVAGTGERGFAGDGGPASSAELWNPQGVAVDAAGNLYIADEGNDRVRRVDAATGIITTVAGRGRSTSASELGDGGPATQAALLSPTSVAVTSNGALYIADSGHNRVRYVNLATGIISTVAGTGEAGLAGDGGPATAATIDYPFALAVGPDGDLYISDFGNHRVRALRLRSGFLQTVVGSGPAGLLSGGFAGDGGPATDARLNAPRGIAFGRAAELYVADSSNSRLRVVRGLVASVMPGDLNRDGRITAADALVALKAAVGLINLPSDLEAAADVAPRTAVGYGDGKITVADAMRILQKAIGLASEWP